MIKSRGVYSAIKMVKVHVEIVYALLASKVEEVLKHCRELTVMFNGVKMVINEHWNDSSNDDDDAGHDVVQNVQEGSGEVGLILQVTGSGGDGWG